MKKYKLNSNHKKIIADTITPVSAYLKLRDVFPNSILLESSEYDNRTNNYSYICCNPISTISIKNNDLKITYPDVKNIKDSVRECLVKYAEDIKEKVEIQHKSKKLLVTGGCGFIGSHFINHIMEKNPYLNVINIDTLYYCADETNIKHKYRKDNRYTFIKGNICSEDLINYILNKYKIDEVVHFAAQSHVQNSFDDSKQFTKDNIEGTHNLLECCRLYGKIKRFIHVSTDEVYGESMNSIDEQKKIEHSVLCPTNPYAATKAGAELIAQ